MLELTFTQPNPGHGTVNPAALQLCVAEPLNDIEMRVRRAAARGDLFKFINNIAILKRDEDLQIGRAETALPGYPNANGTFQHFPPTPQLPELQIPAEPMTDDDILLALLKIQWPLLCNVDLVKRFRTLLHRRTRDEDDKVKKNRKVVEKAITPVKPAIAAKFSNPILRIAADGKPTEQPQPEGACHVQ